MSIDSIDIIADDDDDYLTAEEIKKLDEARDLFQRIVQTAAMNLSATAEKIGERYVGNLIVQEVGRTLGSIIFEVTKESDDPIATSVAALEQAISEAQEVIKGCRGQDSKVNVSRLELEDEMSSLANEIRSVHR